MVDVSGFGPALWWAHRGPVTAQITQLVGVLVLAVPVVRTAARRARERS